MIEHRNEKGELHRVDGPAVVGADGFQAWWLNGKRHRADGPAVVYKSGYREWWLDYKKHRVDGPAVVRANGDCEWWVDGKFIKKEVAELLDGLTLWLEEKGAP